MLATHLTAPATSYIFHGPVGVGKRFAAQMMFKQMACQGTKQPDCTCKACSMVSHPDLRLLEPSGQSYGVPQVRDVTNDAQEYPSSAPYKFYVFDDAHKLTTQASNALLKILEDGPKRSVFIFVLEDEAGLIDTIQSRSVSVRYSSLPYTTVVEQLQKYTDDKDTIKLVANLAGGSIGVGLSYLRGGRMAVRDRALDLVVQMRRKPHHQIMQAVDDEENLDSLIYLLRYMFVDMALIEAGLDERVANFDRLEQLRSAYKALGGDAVACGVGVLNTLYARMPTIKKTHGAHLKSSLLQIKQAISA